ncbi:MAG: aconitate hydratase AcnA, partial [Alphaproteobacteria bacterium]|nr:aconitate hydratase AcnA [Alphaproteobacteria bacterium]
MLVPSDLRRPLPQAPGPTVFVSLEAAGLRGVDRLPVCYRILLENVLRGASADEIDREASVICTRRVGEAISFRPARVLLQDLLGIALMTDLAALRDAVAAAGGDPARVNPRIPSTLVIDHSLRADVTGVPDAPARNLALEHARNTERFSFLRWCQKAFRNLDVVPPGKGIMHQINLERISRVVWTDDLDGTRLAYPDTLIGTDSHTTMVNGICVLGWGVGGIEAEAAMLGRSLSIALPPVLGVEVTGELPIGTTATDLVLVIAERLRKHGVVGKFVEFFGAGLAALSVPDRATIANMSPEYGSTAVLFPIDRATIDYLRLTGRAADQVALVEAYARAQGLWREPSMPASEFDEVITLDLASVRPSIAGPRLPEDRIDLAAAASSFKVYAAKQTPRADAVAVKGVDWTLPEGAVVVAAITSCTNTSNPAGIATAGLLATRAASRGLKAKPWVKTSFAPGSQAIAAFTAEAGLQRGLDALGFNVIGFGCTTCNGMSGAIDERLAEAIDGGGLVATAVLSGNRNFEGRIHPNVRAAYLASPALVVAYAIAGSLDIDITREPLGVDRDGKPVTLAELWPSPAEIAVAVDGALAKTDFAEVYADVLEGDPTWKGLDAGSGLRYRWDEASTYIRRPPYFDGVAMSPPPLADLAGLRPLAILGDSITTDHITPSGAISSDSVGAKFLMARGVPPAEFNSYGTRRGNFELVSRATFANIRLRNRIVPAKEGSWT